eukprot:TRINITY_DN11776_c1_g1_i3.p1 TRINITY_DN11776_c1_g1~~TRINITY_DN11776_c1_g1_i3.p1  ORF type:complete len:338 (-),score=40.14 TRINITY_DN11776_c1_g1_i3:113-1126(-)
MQISKSIFQQPKIPSNTLHKKYSTLIYTQKLLHQTCQNLESQQFQKIKSRRYQIDVSAQAAAGVADPADFEFEQENAQKKKENLFGQIVCVLRAMSFYISSLVIASPLVTTMFLIFPITWFTDKWKRRNQHFFNGIWGKVTSNLFFPVTVHGRENLPPVDEPAVYVANHESYLDIYALFHLNRPFKFISKMATFLVPMIGWSMFLTGHVLLNRFDRRSQIKCLQKCGKYLENGAAVLFFPEGTRAEVPGNVAEFKKGAFSIAVKAGVPVVPVTVAGTGELLPNLYQSTFMYRGTVDVFVHPQMQTKGRDAQELCDEAFEIINTTRQKELQLRKMGIK